MNELNDLPVLLLKQEVAKLLRISVATLKRWEKRGEVKSIRINNRGDRRYLRSDIEALLEAKR